MEKRSETLDEVLDKFSIFGRYHVIFIIIAWFSFAINAINAIQFIFTAEKSGYICRDEGFSSDTCSSVNGTPCSGWIYDDPHSFVAEFDLACQEWKRTLVGTINGFGFMCGILLTGPLSDRFGRKPVVQLMCIIGGVIGLAKSYAYFYWLYMALEFIGAAGDSYLTFHVLKLETVSRKNRVMFSGICNLGFGLGGISVPVAAWAISNWRHYLRTIYTPCFILIFIYVVLLDESPRWLFSKGKKDRAVALIKKIAKKNKVKLDQDLSKLETEDEAEHVSFGKLLKITFGSRILRTRCLICIVWWTTSVFVSFGMKVNSVFLQGNKYINCALVEGLAFPANLISMYIMMKFKRQKPLICCFLASSVFCLIHPWVPRGHPWLSLMIYLVGKLLNTFCFTITYMYTSELFPTYTRNSMQAFCSSVGRIGLMAAPQTPLLMKYWEGLPSLFFGGASLIAGLLTFLVPETANNCLPDTVRDAEAIGKKKKDVMLKDDSAFSEDTIT